MRTVIDCFLYNGEEDILDLRIKELDNVVDAFWIIEGTKTFTGIDKELRFQSQAQNHTWPMSKIKYFPYSFPNLSEDPWINEFAQRNFLGELVHTCDDHDLILYSDVDEIPRPEHVSAARAEESMECFGFRMSVHYLKLNFTMIEPAVLSNSICTIGFSPTILRVHTANDLRIGIRDQSIPAKIIENGGWHFSFLMNRDQVVNKIQSFSHQEFNTPKILNGISVQDILKNKLDLLSREGFIWEYSRLDTLPMTVQKNLSHYRNHLVFENSLKALFNRVLRFLGR